MDKKIVPVCASGKYDIVIGNGILSEAGEIIGKIKPVCRAVIVTDSNVDKLYAEKTAESLKKAGFETEKYVFEAGEKSKSMTVLMDLLEFLASQKITRSDLLVALGGGVVGDLCGFAASCYLRGIDFVQIPTTILSAVDSSVGGKTAVNLKEGKNLAGAFYQPISVICDTDTFLTLPERETACGFAEIIKYGVLFDDNFCNTLMTQKNQINEIVEKCVTFKRDIVERDEFDKGERRLLNLGHTAAHGIEKASKFALTHGEAVGIGMIIAAKISENLGVCELGIHEKITEMLVKYNLPTHYDITAKELCDAALSDKKRMSGTLSLVLVEKIGKCIIYDVNVEELPPLFENALR